MIHSFFFILIGIILGYCGITSGGWHLLLLWPACDFLIIGASYHLWGPRVFGKRPDGSMSRLSLFFLSPYLLFAWSLWYLLRFIRKEKGYDEVSPGIFVGRRPLPGELPGDLSVIVDLTSEFFEYPEVTRKGKYILLPSLDGYVPAEDEFIALLRKVSKEEGKILVHCAEGHGRSGAFAAALLIVRGLARDIDDAITLMQKARKGIHLNKWQIETVRRVCEKIMAGNEEAPLLPGISQ